MTVHDVVTHPVFVSWWGAFGVDFWQWVKADGWTLSHWNWSVATKRWLVGLIMGVFAWLGLEAL